MNRVIKWLVVAQTASNVLWILFWLTFVWFKVNVTSMVLAVVLLGLWIQYWRRRAKEDRSDLSLRIVLISILTTLFVALQLLYGMFYWSDLGRHLNNVGEYNEQTAELISSLYWEGMEVLVLSQIVISAILIGLIVVPFVIRKLKSNATTTHHSHKS